jgi:hypothetical protein
MWQRWVSIGSLPPRGRRRLAVALATMTLTAVGCGTSAGSIPPRTGAPGPSANGTPATDASGDPKAARTFPAPQTAIEPGSYQWEGFERTMSIDLGSGWALGHDNPTFFDLFRGSDFPSITFARFTDVYVGGITRAKAVDAASVATTLAVRTDMTVVDPSSIELGGLAGRQFDLTTTQPQTPLFYGPAGDFKLDPEFKTRYRVLDFPGGGVLVVGIHTRDGRFEDGVALGDPVVATLKVAP